MGAQVITLPPGSSFNEVAGLLNVPAFASAFSVHYSDIYTISCDKYRDILKSFQEVAEHKLLWIQLEEELKEREKKIQYTHGQEYKKRKIKCDEECQDNITIGDYTKPTTFFL